MDKMPEVWFPHLNIKIYELNSVAFNIFGFPVYWYGVIIGSAVICGLLLALREAKRTDQNPEDYIDFLLYALIAALIGARLYYVIFSWESYKDNLLKVFAFREGGLAIYGGVLAAILVAWIFTKKRKLSFGLLADTAAPSLILGQSIGRWGNFFNQEAFGRYTNSTFAMRLMRENVGQRLTEDILNNISIYNGIEYIQVHPTFLYESLWNFGIFLFLLWYRRRKRFTGEVFLLYLIGYGCGRVWIEGLRADQLIIGNTGIAVSQLLSGILIVCAIAFLIYKRKNTKEI
ncbi:prolipoprotein diacylglyceryl transferase [Defluviitalea saccharophila]|uniref:Phosphatidylglycerol--prolipoprotein diacylglyceryl transferase n=1 Tax=Defluviitalea saccharophila TaxID=879970 RepID=A0ABZ2Y870_9FIRM|nr:prolipoprotein diacylglyceryl transferase [Candidatus Epulonipiscium sp.]